MDQRCKTDKVIGNGNWEDYMWPHQIDKTPRLDSELRSLQKNLTFQNWLNFDNHKVHTMEVFMSLKIEHLDKMDIKIGDQIQILNEIKTLKKKKKVIPVKSPSCESSTPSPVKPAVTPQPASDPPFLLISSSGPSADYWSNM